MDKMYSQTPIISVSFWCQYDRMRHIQGSLSSRAGRHFRDAPLNALWAWWKNFLPDLIMAKINRPGKIGNCGFQIR